MSANSTAPDRTARAQCWAARDAFFACLEGTGNDNVASCVKEKAAFEKECAPSWVDYFIKRRQLQKRQDAMMAQSAVNAPPATRSQADRRV